MKMRLRWAQNLPVQAEHSVTEIAMGRSCKANSHFSKVFGRNLDLADATARQAYLALCQAGEIRTHSAAARLALQRNPLLWHDPNRCHRRCLQQGITQCLALRPGAET